MTDTKTLEAKCFCGSVHFTVDIPVSKLPLPVHLCHCSQCRYRSGSPCVFHTRIPADAVRRFVSPSVQGNMTLYDFEGAVSSWAFCSTCGCHITSIENGAWIVATSIFTDHAPENFQIKKHIFSGSAKDGGLAAMLSKVDGLELEDWNPPQGDPSADIVEASPEFDPDNGQQRLRAQCHCGGVSFTIGRPTPEAINSPSLSPYVSPIDKTKWFATFDACSDCRLASGTHLIGWAFLPRSSCHPTIQRDLLIGTAKTYSTSPGVLRSFCGKCGATVFYTTDDRRLPEDEQVVDLATGILRAPEGSMAENWLTWRTKISWLDSGKAFDRATNEALAEGMADWTTKRYDQELWHDIP
jgi:hypothetical protein